MNKKKRGEKKKRGQREEKKIEGEVCRGRGRGGGRGCSFL